MSRLKPRPTRRQSLSRLWRLKPARHTFDPRAHALGYFLPPAVAGSRTRVLEAQTLKEA
jgi:hypothetical protein